MEDIRSLLVIVPHPDDEALLAAGLIRETVLRGAPVSVAVVSNGDYLCPTRDKGIVRLRESLNGMLGLGVPRRNIYFLGYPDTGMEREVSFLHRLRCAQDEREVFPSSCGMETYGVPGEKEDYCFERTGSHASYCRAALEEDLRMLLQHVRPSHVITCAECDRHGDHEALFGFVHNALKELPAPAPALWVGLIHSPDGDDQWPLWGEKQDFYTEPKNLSRESTLRWRERIRIPLSENMRRDKEKLIASYQTALSKDEPDVCRYLLSFAKREEIFWAV